MSRQTIFYAWQSDRTAKVNRYFIRDAAKEAIRILNATANIEDAERVDLEHDTQGVPGMPDVIQTILAKIDACSIFLADLSFVGSTESKNESDEAKLLPNANVGIELGWAMKSIGSERVICVMNTAFGGPDCLPFDLRTRRHPIQYCLPSPDVADRPPPTGRVAEDVIRARAETLKQIEDEQEVFKGRVLRGEFHKFRPEIGVLTVSLSPERPLQPPLQFTNATNRNIHVPTIFGNAEPPQFFGRSCIAVDRYTADDPPFGVAELRQDGNLLSADAYLLSGGTVPDVLKAAYGDKIAGCVPGSECERKLMRAVREYLQLLRKIGVHGNIHCKISMFRVHGFVMQTNSFAFRFGRQLRIFTANELCPDPIIFDEAADISTEAAVAVLLRPAFDYIWLELGYEEGSPSFDEDGKWKSA